MLHFDIAKPDHVEFVQSDSGFEQRKYYDYEDMGKCLMRERFFKTITIAESSGINHTRETIYLDMSYDKDTINTCFLVNSTGHLRSIHPGRVDFQMNNNQYNVGYYPNTVSRNYTPPESEVNLFHIGYNKEHLNNLLDSDESWKRVFLPHLEKENFYVAFEKCIGMTKEMQSIIFDLRYPVLKGAAGEQYLESRALDLLALHIDLLKQHFNLDIQTGINERDRQKLNEIRLFLGRNYSRPDISLALLCREFGINEFKLKKGFRLLFNTSVFGYIIDLKMAEAYQLLADKAMSVSQVSDHLGYSHQGHFTKAFKKKYQVLPSSFKN